MSMVDVEMLLARLREELSRFGSIAEASRRIGEPNALGLRDVCNGRKRLTAELLARLALEGVDPLYVLTGKRLSTRLDLEPIQRAVLDDFDRCSQEKQIEAVRFMALLAEGSVPSAPAKEIEKPRTKGAEGKSKKSN